MQLFDYLGTIPHRSRKSKGKNKQSDSFFKLMKSLMDLLSILHRVDSLERHDFKIIYDNAKIHLLDELIQEKE